MGTVEKIVDKMKGIIQVACPVCGAIHKFENESKLDEKKEIVCLVCDAKFNPRKEYAKSKLEHVLELNVIKYEGDNDTFVWKHPAEDFNIGSKLIVHQTQEAIFFKDGKIAGRFEGGKYTLNTDSLPFLKVFQNMPTGGESSFHSEVYFINKTVQMSLPWGTQQKITFKDPESGALVSMGVSGEMNLRVCDSEKLITNLVGTANGISFWNKEKSADGDVEMNKIHKLDPFVHSIRKYFMPFIQNTVKANLSRIIKSENIDILELDEHLDELSEALREKMCTGFEEYGITIPQMYLNNFIFVEDDAFKVLKSFREEQFKLSAIEHEKKIRLAKQAKELDIEEAGLRQNEIDIKRKRMEKEAEAERARIDAETAAYKTRQTGYAEADVMHAQGYDKKDEFAKDVQIEWARGVGQMGSNGGGGGGMMSDVLAMGAAMATMGTVSDKMSNAMKGIDATDPEKRDTPTTPDVKTAATNWTCACGHEGNTGKFCSECGKPKPEAWVCPNCGKENKGKFCSECGTPKPEAWVCSKCGRENKGKFCSECGTPKENG